MWSRPVFILVSAILVTPMLLLAAFFSGLVWELVPVEHDAPLPHSTEVARQADTVDTHGQFLSDTSNLRPILHAQDVQRYRNIAKLQKQKQWKQADRIIKELDNPLLVGHYLAKRYLGPDYVTSRRELRAWLRQYADHPQIGHMQKLAQQKKAIRRSKALNAPVRPIRYSGDSHSNERFRNRNWKQALADYQAGRYGEAYEYLSNLTARQEAYGWRDWDQSAIHFWAYRTAKALGKEGIARQHLIDAAQASRSFYGILARYKLNKDLQLTREPDPLSTSALHSLYTIPAVRRLVALAQVGEKRLMEAEVHHLFPSLSHSRKTHLLSFIMPLSLPAAQIRMGVALELRGNAPLDYAIYPIPDWEPEDGYLLDPALLMAIARQESGFDPLARSYAGAKGLMQLMPATARYMVEHQRKWNHAPSLVSPDLSDPIQNMALGQRYLHYLMQKDYIGHNLIYLAIAYNAGPGNLLKWQQRMRHIADPLLFIERIPSLETRNYVQNIFRNYWIYRSLSHPGKQGIADTTEALIAGNWPQYPTHTRQIAQILH